MNFDDLVIEDILGEKLFIDTAPMTVYMETDTIAHLARFCVEYDKMPDTIVDLAVKKYLDTLDEIYKVGEVKV